MLGGVGFDINCGVRLLRTNLEEKDVQPVKEQLAQVSMHLPTFTPYVRVLHVQVKNFGLFHTDAYETKSQAQLQNLSCYSYM